MFNNDVIIKKDENNDDGGGGIWSSNDGTGVRSSRLTNSEQWIGGGGDVGQVGGGVGQVNPGTATGWGAPTQGDVVVSSAWSNTPGAPTGGGGGTTTAAIGSTNQPGQTGLERNHQNIANAWGSDPTGGLPGQGINLK